MGPDSGRGLLRRLILNHQKLTNTDLGSPCIAKGKLRLIFLPRKSTPICVWQVQLRESHHWACARGI